MFGDRLKYLRKSHKLTQTDLAEKLNTSQATVGAWETEVRTPDLEMLTKIADIFEVSTDYLIGRNTVPFPTKEEPPQKKKPLTEEEMLKLPLAPGAHVYKEPALKESDFKVFASHSEDGELSPEEKRAILLIAEEVYRTYREDQKKKNKK